MNSRSGNDMKLFFEPDSVAVFGSMRDGRGLGFRAIKNMLTFGYGGRVYPVSPSCDEVLGIRAHPGIDQVDGSVDLALVITPPPTVPGIVEGCARSGVKSAVVVSENFAEAGGEGAEYQRQLVDISQRTGIRIMGPNTIGLLNTANGFTTVPYYISYDSIKRGAIAYCSQSGFVGPTAHPLRDASYPVSKTCDIGNKCDVNEVDLLNYLRDDPETKAVAFHLEDVKDGRAFVEAARRLVARKPLLVLKGGRTEAGARASSSHTASLAGDDEVYSAAFTQAGAIQIGTWHDYWELPRVFAHGPLPRGNRIGIITHTGGAGVVAADTAVGAGLTVASFSDKTLRRLRDLYPRLASNPVDVAPVLSVAENPFQIQEEVIAAVLDDPNTDCVTVCAYGGLQQLIAANVELLGKLAGQRAKTATVWTYGMELPAMHEIQRQLEDRGVPTYLDSQTAVKALGVASRYAAIRRELGRDAS